ncbi:MAG: sulfatase-like hydrolase/transferase [Limisphaerales bacterium]
MKRTTGLLLLAALGVLCNQAVSAAVSKPSFLLILADDLGYGDVGLHGCKDIPTPNIDSIARNGVRFTDGYVSAPVCAPSRAGLMTGRYQDRFGFQGNPARGADWGLPRTEKTFADRMKAGGYATACLGKWHLGETEALHPLNRGFDEFFGFLSGMHSYFEADDKAWGPLLRGRERAPLKGYLTDALGDEACDFIRRKSGSPWFLYLAFNGVHTPMHATPEKLKQFAGIAEEKRRTYAGMVSSLDDAVGRVLEALRTSGQEERTLVFLLSDNGGPLIAGSAANGAVNAPLRGSKLQLWEGGIRVPFMAQWKGRFPAGRVVHQPVISLDLLPTGLAAAGIPISAEWKLDGRNLLPLLTGASEAPVHDRLTWRFYGRPAIREGAWKWVRQSPKEQGLFNLTEDTGEQRDRNTEKPEMQQALQQQWQAWADKLPPPIHQDKGGTKAH